MCDFCSEEVIQNQQISENELARILLPRKPVILGHVLIIPKRHVNLFTELSSEELASMQELIQQIFLIHQEHLEMTGFNLMNNNGETAGQHVPHVHIHMFLRKQDEYASPFDILSKKIEKGELSPEDWSQRLEDLRGWFKKKSNQTIKIKPISNLFSDNTLLSQILPEIKSA